MSCSHNALKKFTISQGLYISVGGKIWPNKMVEKFYLATEKRGAGGGESIFFPQLVKSVHIFSLGNLTYNSKNSQKSTFECGKRRKNFLWGKI